MQASNDHFTSSFKIVAFNSSTFVLQTTRNCVANDMILTVNICRNYDCILKMIQELFNVPYLSDILDTNVFVTLSHFLLCSKGSLNFITDIKKAS